MVIEYKIVLNVGQRPSNKYIMVAIPMNIYRIETNEFFHGLNFFQKSVLKFKSKPSISDENIAQYLGIEPKLIKIISNELSLMGLINEFGSLTDKGREKLAEVDGLVINTSKKRIGYVLQFVNSEKLYPYYVSKLNQPNILHNENSHFPMIITGTKGDGNDCAETPFYLKELLKSKSVQPSPSEKQILQIIKNTQVKRKQSDNDDIESFNIESVTKQLSIRFLNENPEIIWVCTYIYLQPKEDDTYEPDWKVLDPFGFGDNVGLKFYLNTLQNKSLIERIEQKFCDVKTVSGKILSDFQTEINNKVEDRLSDFDLLGFRNLDSNLQEYIKSVVRNYIMQQISDFRDLDASVLFSLNLQKILENLLKHDKENRTDYYNSVYSDFDNERKKREGLETVFGQRVFSRVQVVPQKLINASKGNLKNPISLLSYLAVFVLTYHYDRNSPLFKIFKNQIDIIIEVSQLRNEIGHGQTTSERSLTTISKENAQKYYNFIKNLINNYIQKP